jgi:large subunit ribosomal protein L21
MYAVIETGGKQYSVQKGNVLYVEKLDVEPGDTIAFDKVLAFVTDEARFGTPYLDDVRVTGKVVKNGKAKKIMVFKYKAKKNCRRRQGHRQPYTKIEITDIGVA